jgi:hypothetical protein
MRWVVDFRDGWITSLRRRREKHSAFAEAVEGSILRSWLRACDHGLCVDADIEAQARRLIPTAPITLLPHLPLELELAGGTVPFTAAPGEVSLVHTGSFSLSEPTTDLGWVLDALAPAFSVQPRLHWHLFGRLTQRERALLASPPWASRVSVYGPVQPAVSRAAQRAADVLLAANAPALDYPPGKLTEYRASHRPVVALGHPGWTTAVNAGEAQVARLLRLAAGRVPDAPDPTLARIAEQVRSSLAQALGV